MSPADFDQEYGRYLAGDMTDDERTEFERRVAGDPELSEEVYADTNMQEAMQPAAIVRGPAHWWRWAAPLAAAAIIVLGINLMQPGDETADPVMRGTGQVVELLSPTGTLDAIPSRFEWMAVEGAARYRFELLDGQARVVHRTVVATPFVVMESGVPTDGSWRVEALDDVGQTLGSSSSTSFEVSP